MKSHVESDIGTSSPRNVIQVVDFCLCKTAPRKTSGPSFATASGRSSCLNVWTLHWYHCITSIQDLSSCMCDLVAEKYYTMGVFNHDWKQPLRQWSQHMYFCTGYAAQGVLKHSFGSPEMWSNPWYDKQKVYNVKKNISYVCICLCISRMHISYVYYVIINIYIYCIY